MLSLALSPLLLCILSVLSAVEYVLCLFLLLLLRDFFLLLAAVALLLVSVSPLPLLLLVSVLSVLVTYTGIPTRGSNSVLYDVCGSKYQGSIGHCCCAYALYVCSVHCCTSPAYGSSLLGPLV
jgi:hypothetical protein